MKATLATVLVLHAACSGSTTGDALAPGDLYVHPPNADAADTGTGGSDVADARAEADSGGPAEPHFALLVDGQPLDLGTAIIRVSVHQVGEVHVSAREADGGDYPLGISASVGLNEDTAYLNRVSYTDPDGVSFESTAPSFTVPPHRRCPGDLFEVSFGARVTDPNSGRQVELSEGELSGRICYYTHGQPLPTECPACGEHCYPDCY